MPRLIRAYARARLSRRLGFRMFGPQGQGMIARYITTPQAYRAGRYQLGRRMARRATFRRFVRNAPRLRLRRQYPNRRRAYTAVRMSRAASYSAAIRRRRRR